MYKQMYFNILAENCVWVNRVSTGIVETVYVMRRLGVCIAAWNGKIILSKRNEDKVIRTCIFRGQCAIWICFNIQLEWYAPSSKLK